MKAILQEAVNLKTSEKLVLIEILVKSLQREDQNRLMQESAENLRADYIHDKELIAFTDLDLENFYEVK